MSDGAELSGYAALTRPTMLMLQAGLDNKAAAAALPLKTPAATQRARRP